jgi:hypothetical protein
MQPRCSWQAREHLLIALPIARRWGVRYWGGWGVRAACYFAALSARYADAYMLYGASHVLRDNASPWVPRPGGKLYDVLSLARSSLAPSKINELIGAGRTLTADEAMGLALETLESSGPYVPVAPPSRTDL